MSEFVFSRRTDTKFGDDLTNVHQITGSSMLTGSAEIKGGDLVMFNGNVEMSGTATVDGVDVSELSFSADLRLTELENASASFTGDITNLYATTSNLEATQSDLVADLTELEATASNHEIRIDNAEVTLSRLEDASGSFAGDINKLFSTASNHETRINVLETASATSGTLWTGSNGAIGRESDVSITGSLLITGGNIEMSESATVDGVDISEFSASVENRLNLLEAETGSLSSSIVNIETTISDHETRIDHLEITASDHETRIDALELLTGSLWTGSSDGSYISRLSNVQISGNLDISGIVTAQEFHTELVTASVIYESGSTKFGDDCGDQHDFTGSLNVSCSVDINGDLFVSNTASFGYVDIDTLNVSSSTFNDITINGTASINHLYVTNSAIFEGDLFITGNIHISGTVDGVDISDFSESVSERLTNEEYTSSDHETRIVILENASASMGLWTSSIDGYISRDSNVQITGNLDLDGNTTIGNACNDKHEFTGSVNISCSLIVNGCDFDDIKGDVDDLQSTASDHETRIDSLESGGDNGFWTGSGDGSISRDSNVCITGTLCVTETASVADTPFPIRLLQLEYNDNGTDWSDSRTQCVYWDSNKYLDDDTYRHDIDSSKIYVKRDGWYDVSYSLYGLNGSSYDQTIQTWFRKNSSQTLKFTRATVFFEDSNPTCGQANWNGLIHMDSGSYLQMKTQRIDGCGTKWYSKYSSSIMTMRFVRAT